MAIVESMNPKEDSLADSVWMMQAVSRPRARRRRAPPPSTSAGHIPARWLQRACRAVRASVRPCIAVVAVVSVACSGADVETLYPECVQRFDDEVLIRNATDLVLYTGISRFSGHVLICRSNDITDLRSLSALRVVEGDLLIFGNSALQSLSGLENLQTVGRNLIVSRNSTLQSLDGLSNLEIVGGDVVIRNKNNRLETAELPKLTSVGGYLTIEYNPRLTRFRAEVLSAVGFGMNFWSNDELVEVHLGAVPTPDFDTTIHIDVESNPCLITLEGLEQMTYLSDLDIKDTGLAELHFPALTFVSTLAVRSNAALVSLDFPVLRRITSDVDISYNAALVSLDFPALRTIRFDVDISNNPQLPTCAVQALLDGADVKDPDPEITGNDDLATCP